MKNNRKQRRILALAAVMLCMAVFLFPTTAFAMSDTIPPDVTGSVTGDVLHVDATDDNSGVEAVFINGKRFNYLVDGGLDVPLQANGLDGEAISVYAIDFAGNQSDTVQIQNPLYAAPAQQPDRLTPDGNMSLVDDVSGEQAESKQFITVETKNGNVFYIIIDRAGDTENVYFLNLVDEADLMRLLEELEEEPAETSPIFTPQPEPTPDPEPATEPEPEPEKSGGGIGGILVVLLLLAAGGGGAYYYFKILKPKKAAAQSNTTFDELEFEDEDDGLTGLAGESAYTGDADEREDGDE